MSLKKREFNLLYILRLDCLLWPKTVRLEKEEVGGAKVSGRAAKTGVKFGRAVVPPTYHKSLQLIR